MAGVETISGFDFSLAKLNEWFAPFDDTDHIALAVSGGGDSVAMMALAQRWQKGVGAPKITILTVNHNLRAESADEAEQVGQWARALGFDHVVLAWVGEKPLKGLQAAAREARYGLMLNWCVAHGVEHLGLAHNLEDQAETVVMRLARGSGLDGLAAMAPVSWRGAVALVRPLLGVSRADLRIMLTKADQPWLEDPSNQDHKFERVRVRKLLEELKAVGLDAEKMAVTAHRLGRARTALDHIAREAAQMTVTLFEAGFCVLNLKAFLESPQEIGLRVLKFCLVDIGRAQLAPQLERLETLYARLQSSNFTASTLSGCRIMLKRDVVIIAREPGRSGLPEVQVDPGTSLVWDRRFDVALTSMASRPMMVRALGSEGQKNLKENAVLRSLPASIARILPSLWLDNDLLAVPHLDFYAKSSYVKHINMRYCASGNLDQPKDLTPDELQRCGIFTKLR